jgi:hypothetical protein
VAVAAVLSVCAGADVVAEGAVEVVPVCASAGTAAITAIAATPPRIFERMCMAISFPCVALPA